VNRFREGQVLGEDDGFHLRRRYALQGASENPIIVIETC
jgi:hypothetical protein